MRPGAFGLVGGQPDCVGRRVAEEHLRHRAVVGGDGVRRHKPAPGAYHSVAAALAVDLGDVCLIASHVWDTIGAGAAGWQTALILREGNAPLDVGPQPDYIGKDLDAIADQLIERYAAASKASGPGRPG